MARFKKLLRTTNSVEELLGLIDSAVKIALKYHRPHQWEWRELSMTPERRLNEKWSGDAVMGVPMSTDLKVNARFKGYLLDKGLTVVALVLYTGCESWGAPYGEESFDDYGVPLEPESFWLYVGAADGKRLFTKRFSFGEHNRLIETKYSLVKSS